MKIEVDIGINLKGFTLTSQFEGTTDRIGILGASGCGKSMTLKAIAGIVTPDVGRIVVNDKVYFDAKAKINVAPQQRRIGYLFQNYALFPTQTVEKNIAAGLGGWKKDAIKKRVAYMLDKFELTGLEKRYPRELSGGQQQRVALARIMAYEPDVIMLDEPFSALDSFLKDSLKMEMKRMLDDYQGGMLMVSHSRDEIYEFTNQLLVMGQGKIVENGDTRHLFDKPQVTETAKLTGCKNISAIERLEDYKVYAKDWDLVLVTNESVPIAATHIGVRAHNIHRAKGDEVNCFQYEMLDQSETPFEYKYIIKKAGSKGGKIWWLLAKAGVPLSNTQKVYVKPEDLIILTN